MFTVWVEGSAPGDLGWLKGELATARPPVGMVCGLISDKGEWQLSVADELAPFHDELEFRPFDNSTANHENHQWQHKSPEQWILDAKAQLQGRPYRVTVFNEPKFKGDELVQQLAWLVKLCENAAKHEQKIGIGGWQSRVYEALNQHPDRIDGGKWRTLMFVVGELSAWVQMDFTEYGQYAIPPCVGNPDYLETFITDPELLRDPRTWTPPIDTYNHPYRNREMLRYRWWQLYAQEIGAKPHKAFIREGWIDFADVPDLGRATDLNGGVVPKGINTVRQLTEWKFEKPFDDSMIEQHQYLFDCYALDPYLVGAACYQYGIQEGDKQYYAVNGMLRFIKTMLHYKPKRAEVPAPIPVPPLPVVILPAIKTYTLEVTTSVLRLRSAPLVMSDNIVGRLFSGAHVTFVGTADDLRKLGDFEQWLEVTTSEGLEGYANAEWLKDVTPPPIVVLPPPSWRTAFTDGELKVVDAAFTYDPDGLLGKLAKALAWNAKL